MQKLTDGGGGNGKAPWTAESRWLGSQQGLAQGAPVCTKLMDLFLTVLEPEPERPGTLLRASLRALLRRASSAL